MDETKKKRLEEVGWTAGNASDFCGVLNMWEPGDSFAIRFSDETAEERTEKDLDNMVDQMKQIANDFGFDLDCYGGWEGIKKVVIGEEEILKKYNS